MNKNKNKNNTLQLRCEVFIYAFRLPADVLLLATY